MLLGFGAWLGHMGSQLLFAAPRDPGIRHRFDCPRPSALGWDVAHASLVSPSCLRSQPLNICQRTATAAVDADLENINFVKNCENM